MKNPFLLCLVTLGLGLLSACGGGGGGAAPVGPSIAGGNWAGVYFVEGRSGVEEIKASISQNGDVVKISTTKAEGVGRLFTGSIDASGDMALTDAYDGELWTTYRIPAAENFIEIDDFTRRPSPSDPSPPLQIIQLSR